MTEKFLRAIEKVLVHEGGYVNDPVDPGGETKFGISKRSYPDLDIKNLSEDQAKEIYFHDFWTRYKFESISPDALAAKLLDVSVNVGAKRAVRFLQEGLCELGARIGIDGAIGSETINAINHLPEDQIMDRFRKNAEIYYVGLNQPHFLAGWLKRLNED